MYDAETDLPICGRVLSLTSGGRRTDRRRFTDDFEGLPDCD